MNGLSLCAGIGGLDLGLHLVVPGYRTVCYVEKEPFCQDVLLARMADGVLDQAPIWGDIATFDARPWSALVDIVHGGYPCQPFSVAGKRAGAADSRHLWPHVARVMAECRPTYGFFENVSGHLSLGFREIARDLEGLGYRVSAGLFTAVEVGAPHRRQRLYILARRYEENGVGVADAECSKWRLSAEGRNVTNRLDTRREETAGGSAQCGSTLDLEREGSDEWPVWPPGPEERNQWTAVLARWPELAPATQPPLRRMAHGVPHRTHRLKALGNAVVPDVAATAWTGLQCDLNNAS